jgi:hypothetical protein
MKTVVGVDVGAGNTNVIAAKDGHVISSFMFPSGVGLDVGRSTEQPSGGRAPIPAQPQWTPRARRTDAPLPHSLK